MLRTNTKYKVLTPDGFQSFAGVNLVGVKPVVTIYFTDGNTLTCTADHKLYKDNTTMVTVSELLPGDSLFATGGYTVISEIIDHGDSIPVYDLIEVDNGHRFFANDILSSNCEFLVFDETLIDSICLSELVGKEPIMKTGQTRWYKEPTPNNIYVVAWDPSLGTGGDYAAIQVFELPSFIQIAEWHHNITSIQDQGKILRDILQYLEFAIGNDLEASRSIYWSIENNSLGEAGLLVIEDFGERTFPGLLVSEPIRRGHVRSYRKGFNTTYGSKISACSKLKFFVEANKMKINSRILISELKSFVAAGKSFKGKSGQHDDLVMATLLAIRISVILAEWDPNIFDAITARDNQEIDWELPMPIVANTYSWGLIG